MKDLNSQVVPSITAVLKKISDDKTLTLFNSIAGVDGDKNIPLKIGSNYKAIPHQNFWLVKCWLD